MDPKAFHVLSYGSFLGITLFQSFVGGVVAYKVLPRPQFARLQQATFPVFFSLQTILPAIMMVTYPGDNIASAGRAHLRGDSGLAGVFDESNRWTVLAPLATILITSAVNLLLLGPATTKAMKERHHQGECARDRMRECRASRLTAEKRQKMGRRAMMRDPIHQRCRNSTNCSLRCTLCQPSSTFRDWALRYTMRTCWLKGYERSRLSED